jgi:type IV pilus assembly protein PilX
MHAQRGAVLVVSMLMLLVLTLVGITAMRLSTQQEKMSGNSRDMDIALQAAEAALRFGESRLVTPTLPDPASLPGWYYYPTPSLRAPSLRRPQDWGSAVAIEYPINADYWDVAQSPRLTIEDLGNVPDPDGSLDASAPVSDIRAFRVSARAVGGVASTNVILQSTFQRR